MMASHLAFSVKAPTTITTSATTHKKCNFGALCFAVDQIACTRSVGIAN